MLRIDAGPPRPLRSRDLMWGMLAFVIALRGGGPYSVDRKIGREL